jgi:hypothetical protein
MATKADWRQACAYDFIAHYHGSLAFDASRCRAKAHTPSGAFPKCAVS